MRKLILTAMIGAAAGSAQAHAAQDIKIGLLVNSSSAIAAIGKEVEMGFDLGIQGLDGKLGGLPAKVYKEDPGMTPETALQATSRLLERHGVDIVVGPLLSNQIGALTKIISDNNAILISPLPGPAPLAGKQCNRNVFITSWQNEMASEALGKYVADQGIARVSVVSHNYVTGRDSVSGFIGATQAKVLSEAYVPLGHMDYAAEIAGIRAARPDAVFAFAIGGSAISFVKQYAAAGLMQDIPVLAGSYIADEHSFKALGNSALGVTVAGNWFADLPNAANGAFVDAFRKAHGRTPVFYAANAYDTVRLIDSAVSRTGGKIENRDLLIDALEQADFASVRGNFSFNRNHFPIQDFYIAKVVEKDGRLQHQTLAKVVENMHDHFAEQCAFE